MSPECAEPEMTWNKLVTDFREACLLRKEGRLVESDRILHDQLPRLISLWSRENPKDSSVKKGELETMFRDEQKRVHDAHIIQHLVMSRLAESYLPSLCSKVAEEVRDRVSEELGVAADARSSGPRKPFSFPAPVSARVAFDDVPAIIDLLLEEQTKESSLALHG